MKTLLTVTSIIETAASIGLLLLSSQTVSGDLARRDGDGYLWFEGRKKEIIVRDGLNISPQQVEEAIYDHPAVLEAAVIGVPDPVGSHGERLLAPSRPSTVSSTLGKQNWRNLGLGLENAGLSIFDNSFQIRK